MKFLAIFICFFSPLFANSTEYYSVEFEKVQLRELIKFVSKVTGKQISTLGHDFGEEVTFILTKPASPEEILYAFMELLRSHQIHFHEDRKVLHLEKKGKNLSISRAKTPFHVVKLQYTSGQEITNSIKAIGADRPDFDAAMQTMQWIEANNSLLFRCSEEIAREIKSLISSLDTPSKQVFIEILVLETSVRSGAEFGLEWSASGQIDGRLDFHTGNLSPNSQFARKTSESSASSSPFSVGSGFDLGIIGDIIFHKGKSFISLGSLLKALQHDRDSTIVLSQKIIAQDNKTSQIFVGDNIPFPSSSVETIGAAQQTTANIEYRDVGVQLKITPLVGERDVITLQIAEEITQAVPSHYAISSSVSGIQTTKTEMITRAHVPNESFLVLSGMTRNAASHRNSQIPCLGSIPILGALAFSHLHKEHEKRCVLIFVRPRIVHHAEEYNSVTKKAQSEIPSYVPNDSIRLTEDLK